MENLITFFLAITYVVILFLAVKSAINIHNKYFRNKKVHLIMFFLICSIFYGKAQTVNELIAGNFSDNDLEISNPIKVNYELSGLPAITPPAMNNQVMKIDDNNSITIQIENQNTNGAEVSVVNIIANGVTTQKIIFKGESMSCVEFPGLNNTKHTSKRSQNRCE